MTWPNEVSTTVSKAMPDQADVHVAGGKLKPTRKPPRKAKTSTQGM